jgi:hypothetical protein
VTLSCRFGGRQRHLAGELARQGRAVPAPTAGRLLRENGFSLQGNAKTLEGEQHPDRDAQFCYINEQVKDHQPDGEPVISADIKKREQWHPKGEPVQVEDHSFFTGPDVGPPTQQDGAKYAPGEPQPKTCA